MMLKELLAYIHQHIQITPEENDAIYAISISTTKDEIVKCLLKIEEYLAENWDKQALEEELKRLQYACIPDKIYKNGADNCLSRESYHSSPWVQLLLIRKVLIEELFVFLVSQDDAINGYWEIAPKTGSWLFLFVHPSHGRAIKAFELVEDIDVARSELESKIKLEIQSRLVATEKSDGINYFAFRLSNGVFSEPYILKIAHGKIEEVIASTSRHSSSELHAYLYQLIKKNFPNCKIHHTLPLEHDGDCTRYADYALIQFHHLSQEEGEDAAFDKLAEKEPYFCNRQTLRDFQMLSRYLNYDPFEREIYPLAPEIQQLLSSSNVEDDILEDNEKLAKPPIFAEATKIENFKKIYRALYKTESSIFSQNFVKKLEKKLEVKEQEDAILKQSQKYPDAKSAFAWQLVAKYEGNLSDIRLIQDIHRHAHSKRRFFDRSKNREILEASRSVEELSLTMHKKSTTETILKCLMLS